MLYTSAAVADGGISARQAAGMKFPLETLQSLKQFAIEKDHEAVNAVLDKKTGRLLEYKQLISHPK